MAMIFVARLLMSLAIPFWFRGMLTKTSNYCSFFGHAHPATCKKPRAHKFQLIAACLKYLTTGSIIAVFTLKRLLGLTD